MFFRSVVARMIGALIFLSIIAAAGFLGYQAGVAQGAEMSLPVQSFGAPFFGLAGLGALCLGGALFFMVAGSLVFAFCPRQFRERMKSREYDN